MNTTNQKNVLVTGSTSGFGRSIVETLSRKGHRVFATMRAIEGKNSGVAQELREWAQNEGVELETFELDVTDDASVDSAVESILDKFGRIDVVVNNAGIGSGGFLEGFTSEQVKMMFDVNTIGPLRVNRAVLPHMRENKSGLLIHITSATGRLYIPGLNLYSGAKYALEALVESYSHELAPFNIDCVSIEPGGYGTDIGANSMAASDTGRLAGYGEGAHPGLGLYAYFEKHLSGPDAPDPKEIADGIIDLMEMPEGERPLRVVIGTVGTEGLDELNRVTDKIQKEYLDSMGL